MKLKPMWIIAIVLAIALLLLPMILDFNNSPNGNNQTAGKECKIDSDCIPASCCHPTSCMPQSDVKVCNLLCTQECVPGTLDCGQGSCVCNAGVCGAKLK